MNPDPVFSKDYQSKPYWWERTPRPSLEPIELPKETEVLVVGSGYTGLCTSLQTSRNGLETLVLDAEDAGWGGSSRNGGQISTSLKPGFDVLSAKFGAEKARAILKEGIRSLDWIGEFIEQEKIDCDFQRVGRFYGAHTPRQFRLLEKKIVNQPEGLEVPIELITREEQHSEIGTDFYHGGIVHPHHASLDPARFHQGLLEAALSSGVSIKPQCEVQEILQAKGLFHVSTSSGVVKAKNVVIATSGYNRKTPPWFKRRIIPIGSYIIATEELDPALVDELIPKNRVITDTRKLVVYYRASPDRKRILFGGRVSLNETDPQKSAPALHQQLVTIFPQLASTQVSHSWMGFVGYTFDEMPHSGEKDGIFYSMGYCGSGVSLSSYFGTRLGQRIAGLPEGETPLTLVPFQTRPFYSGNPWFLAPSILFYQMKDRYFS